MVANLLDEKMHDLQWLLVGLVGLDWLVWGGWVWLGGRPV